MGCIQSNRKSKRKVKLNGNENFKDLNEVYSVAETDERLPLNARQVFKLKQSWKGIKRKSAEAGVEMFIRYENVLFDPLSTSRLRLD